MVGNLIICLYNVNVIRWPCYICDPKKMRENMHMLGAKHKTILRRARNFSSTFHIVYWLGSYDLYVHFYKTTTKG